MVIIDMHIRHIPTLAVKVRLTNRDIKQIEEGVTNTELSSGMALALERVITSVVRPLQWYPFIFLVFAGVYIVWVISVYGKTV